MNFNNAVFKRISTTFNTFKNVKTRSPKPNVEGSSPSAPVLKKPVTATVTGFLIFNLSG